MKIYKIDFRYFDGAYWEYINKTIQADTKISLMKTFIDETTCVSKENTPKTDDNSLYYQSEKQQRKLLWNRIKDDLEVINLPIVEEYYS